MNIKKVDSKRGFTLIEVLVVIGVIIVLTLAVLYFLNPHQLITEGQDGNRVAGIGTLDKGIALYYSDAITNPTKLSLGSSSVIYISIPDPTATTTAGTNCAGLGISPSPGVAYTYHCAASSTYLSINGTGWIPINFTNYSGGSIFPTLPVDPVNTTSSGEYYVYVTNGSQYELMANPASVKDASDTADFDKGYLSLETSFPLVGGGSSGGGGGTITYTTSTPYMTYGDDGVLGVAFDSHTNSIWITNGLGEGDVTQINDTSYATSTYSTGNDSEAIAFDSHTNSIWITNLNGGNVTQVNDTTHAISTYSVEGYPEAIAFDSHTNSIWVASYDGTITQINDTSYATYTYNVGSSYSFGIAFDPHTNSIWVTNSYSGTVTQINDTSYATSTYSVGGSSPVGIAFDSHTNSIWVASYNVLTQINDTSYATSTYSVGSNWAGIAFDPHTNSIWIGASGGSNTLTQINDTTYATSTYIVGNTPEDVAFDSHTNSIWVANEGDGTVTQLTPSQ